MNRGGAHVLRPISYNVALTSELELELARIERMHMEYIPGEDRIRLRVRTSDPAEVRCWLTRRFTRHLWQALEKTMADDPELAAASSPGERSARLARKHERANALSPAREERADAETQSEAKTQGEQPAEFPLGPQPLLITRLRVRRTEHGHRLSLLPPDDETEGLHINMDETLLHRFAALLARSAEQTDWGLELKPPSLAGALGGLQPGERVH